MLDSGTRFGPFVVERLLGEGSTGIVYQCFHNEQNVPVAIKFLSPDLAKDAAFVTMFEAEAKTGLKLNHPNIVRTLTVGRLQGLPFIVFEFVSGVALQNLIQKGPLAEGECVWILRQMAQGLRELRKKGILHQDIKPANILIEGTGNCKLTDLGFARATQGRNVFEGAMVGTAFYMSPEQCQEGAPVDFRSDLYALGATLYHAATGGPPFPGQDEAEVIDGHLNKKAPLASAKNPKLGSAFVQMLAKLLEKDPAQRYQNAEELLLEMRSFPVPAVAPKVTVSRLH